MIEIDKKIKELEDRLKFYESFGSGGKVWIQPTGGPTLEQEIDKVKAKLEVLRELKINF